jgi:glyoxylase-like metal-dependent hydrolase (beta-lactamase superfamily II)
VDVIEILPRLRFLRFPVGHAYLWQDPDGLTLVDAGAPGSAPLIAAAVRGLGHDVADVRRLVLTHCHIDHTGAAPEIASWGRVTVFAHRLDAPVIRGEAPAPLPKLADWEKPIFEQVAGRGPIVPPVPVRVDREVGDGDALGFGAGARAVSVPGHTPGSIAIYLPEPGVLFTGDAVACHEGRAILGAFNADPAQAADSLRKLADLDAEIACFGHGDPITREATAGLRAAAARLPASLTQ